MSPMARLTLGIGAGLLLLFVTAASLAAASFSPAPACDGDTVITPTLCHAYLPMVKRDPTLTPTPTPTPLPEVPLYSLSIAPNDLAWLLDENNLYNDTPVPATFFYERNWDVETRLRGDVSRLMPKKNWKVFFPGSDLFQGSDELNLNADYPDQTFLRSYIAYDLFSRVGVPAPRATYARLNINDDYYGFFSQVEQVDTRFLHRMGLEIHGNLYKPYYGNLRALGYTDPWVRLWWYKYYYPKKTNRQSSITDVISFIETISYASDEEFTAAMNERLDIEEWTDWYAVNVLIGNFEMMEKNYYMYHDLSTDRWLFFPWDLDLTFGHNMWGIGWGGLLDTELSWDNPIDSGTHESPKCDGKWNGLIDRMMGVPEYRYLYCRRLAEIMDDEFSPAEMFPRIDAAYDYIHTWAEADTNRWQPEGFEFSEGPAELKTYITNRIAFLQGEMPGFCPALTLPLTINEVGPGWVEVYNGSDALTWNLDGMYLTDIISEPTRWRVPTDTLIPPGGVVLFAADGDEAAGPLHTNFTLTVGGGAVALFDKDVFNRSLVSVLTYTALATGTSDGRLPDCIGPGQVLTAPTPGWLNVGRPPAIVGTRQTPAYPAIGESVTVTTLVSDREAVTVTLHYRAFLGGDPPPEEEMAVQMTAIGGGRYQTVLPAQPEGMWVEYYITAVDETGLTALDRPGWPQGDYRYIVGWQPLPLHINELLAINTSTAQDEYGDYSDWLELYNSGDEAIDLTGMFLSNNVGQIQEYSFPAGSVIPAHSYLLLWADDDPGANHLGFKLSGAGEYVGLFASSDDHYAPIDAVYFDPQTPDVSWGRLPDGDGDWRAFSHPTPGASNRPAPPQFAQVARTPQWPRGGEVVTVTASITAGSGLISATLWYSAEGMLHSAPLSPTATGLWQQTIPSYTAGTLVEYYLSAQDDCGQERFEPAAAPAVAHRYLVSYTPPAVVINEFLASNDTVNQDEAGEYDDWVELYNQGTVTASLGGMYLTDALDEPTQWRVPTGTVIPPGGYLLIWCDGDEEQGPLHANFRLRRRGESLGLFADDAHRNVPLDMLDFGTQQTDVSYGRVPDGAASWEFILPPTPGESNLVFHSRRRVFDSFSASDYNTGSVPQNHGW